MYAIAGCTRNKWHWRWWWRRWWFFASAPTPPHHTSVYINITVISRVSCRADKYLRTNGHTSTISAPVSVCVAGTSIRSVHKAAICVSYIIPILQHSVGHYPPKQRNVTKHFNYTSSAWLVLNDGRFVPHTRWLVNMTHICWREIHIYIFIYMQKNVWCIVVTRDFSRVPQLHNADSEHSVAAAVLMAWWEHYNIHRFFLCSSVPAYVLCLFCFINNSVACCFFCCLQVFVWRGELRTMAGAVARICLRVGCSAALTTNL